MQLARCALILGLDSPSAYESVGEYPRKGSSMPHLRSGYIDWVCYREGYAWVRLFRRPKRTFKVWLANARMPVMNGEEVGFGDRSTSSQVRAYLRRDVPVLVLVETNPTGKDTASRIVPTELWDSMKDHR